MSYVYIIAPERGGSLRAPVKIGLSDNPWARAAAMQTASADQLVVAFAFPLQTRERACAIERSLHGLFAPQSVRGEWFNVSPVSALMAVIEHLFQMFEEQSSGDHGELDRLIDQTNLWGAVGAARRLAGLPEQ